MNNPNDVQIRATDKVECECCDYIYDPVKYKESELPGVGRNPSLAPCKAYGSIIMCPKCLTAEISAKKILDGDEEERLKAEKNRAAQVLLEKSLQIDQTVQIQQDLFNAKLVSINDLKTAIDADDSIPADKKHITLAKTLEERHTHLNNVINGATQTMKDAQNEQRAIQQYYNELAKKLRADEREQIKLKDVQYQPPVKTVKTQKAPTVKKYDKNAIREAAKTSGLPEAAIQMVCVARQVTPLEAVRIIVGATNDVKGN